jgi:hypothetical protein
MEVREVGWKKPFPRAAVAYIALHADESRSVLAYRIHTLFGYPCTKEGIKGVIRQLKKKERPQAVQS